jgi:hypothetical protein
VGETTSSRRGRALFPRAIARELRARARERTARPPAKPRRPPQVEANHLTENAGIRQKLETKINAKNAIKADESAKGALDKLIEAYEKTVAGIKTTLETEPAPPEEDATSKKPVAEAVGEVVDAAAGDDHKNPEAVAEAKAKLTEEAEQAQQRAEEEKKAEEEDKVPKYVLTKYERVAQCINQIVAVRLCPC